MSKDQIAIVLLIIGLLAGAIQQFYALKSEVAELRLKMEYVHGAEWSPPQ